MRLTLTAEFTCPAATVWYQAHRPELLQWIAWPLLRFTPRGTTPWPRRWVPGRYRARVWGFGIIPLGSQWIGVEHPQGATLKDGRGVLRDNGSGTLIRVWDHWVFIEDLGVGRTRYTDRLDVKAGVLTPMVWLFARIFYGHRQKRWNTLISENFTQLDAK